MLRINKALSQRGSLTIEAAIIFSTVFFMLIALIYIALLMYQQSYLQSLAAKAAQRGAAVYSSSSKDMFIGSIYVKDMKDRNPYDSLLNLDKDKKEGRIISFINSQIKAFSLLGSEQPDIKVQSHNYVMYQKIEVTISEKYKLPVGKFLSKFGLSPSFPVSARAEAVVSNPAEFIRNSDFITETASELMDTADSGSNGISSGIKKKLSATLFKIKSLFTK